MCDGRIAPPLGYHREPNLYKLRNLSTCILEDIRRPESAVVSTKLQNPKKTVVRAAAKPPAAERIVAAAYRCFDDYGIAKTTMEDVAAAAELSRASVYKYFGSKDEIVAHITDLEIAKINTEVRQRFVRKTTIAESLAECLFLVVRAAMRNHCLRLVLQTIDYPSRAADPGSAAHRKQRGWWGTLLDDALKSGEFASDLSVDEIVSWLTLAEQMLVIKVEAVDIGDDELRRFIRRMVILPLVQRPGA